MSNHVGNVGYCVQGHIVKNLTGHAKGFSHFFAKLGLYLKHIEKLETFTMEKWRYHDSKIVILTDNTIGRGNCGVEP